MDDFTQVRTELYSHIDQILYEMRDVEERVEGETKIVKKRLPVTSFEYDNFYQLIERHISRTATLAKGAEDRRDVQTAYNAASHLAEILTGTYWIKQFTENGQITNPTKTAKYTRMTAGLTTVKETAERLKQLLEERLTQ
jgi:hypothetical protein